MFWEIFAFELKFRFKSISLYVYFFLWLAFAFLDVAAENFGPIANSNGKVYLNGPYANTYNDIGAAFFGTIVIAAIFGTSILRDFQRDTVQIMFTKPFSKFSYLGGRWAGSFVACVFAFSGCLFGTYLGTFAPWADGTRIAPNHLSWYLQPFLSVVVIQVFFMGSLFFTIAALSRRIFVVYLQGAVFFMAYLIGITVFTSTRSLEHFWSGILDPIGFLYSDAIARYWTVVEKNSQLFSWSSNAASGVFLYNRLFWISLGVVSLGVLWALFPVSVEALTARFSGKRAAVARELEDDAERPRRRSFSTTDLPKVHPVFGWQSSLAQFRSLTRLRMSNILRDFPFWSILALMVANACTNGHFAGRVSGVNVWPVTYLMLQSVEGGSVLFLYIVATLYAGELIWRERDTNFHGIHDALPMRESVDWLSKFLALAVIELILLFVAGLCGIVMQTIAGYYHYELLQYGKELFLITFPQVMTFALIAMFVQTVVNNKFIGHAIVIGIAVLTPILFSFGFENTLYLVGNTPPYMYSDMNGYGHFIPGLFWSITYWLAVAALLGTLSIGLARRGAETNLRARIGVLRDELPRLAPAALAFLAIAIGSGCWFYYNAHVLNEYFTGKDRRHLQAEYEKEFKKYERTAQPKVIAVDAAIDLYPERRAVLGTGSFVLQNKTGTPIREIYITNTKESVADVRFAKPFHVTRRTPRSLFTTYTLDQPLTAGEQLKMDFKIKYEPRGFRDGNERPDLAYNGTFIDDSYFPRIGYDRNYELDDPRRRREEHLGELEELPSRDDVQGNRTNLFVPFSDWISYRTVVSTADDQLALAPGYLQKEWHSGGRHYFQYDMGAVKTLDFFAYISGRYQVDKQIYNGKTGPVSIEVYHDRAHPYDIADMLASSRAGLQYYEQHYSPFQFQQYRILEFPRYRGFAQSFPNTIPYSESIGFIGRVEKPTDIDFTYFVTAHELGHQWWGHQLIGGGVEGSNMMSETLAEYSALMVMQRRYGPDNMHRFLKNELDRYLRGRSGEVRKERPLVLVQNEPYVWYQKGGQVMYTLADYIGEDKVDNALRNFLLKYRYANADDALSGPYPNTRQFVAALRAETPADLQYYIDEAFENIVLYDNKANSAVVTSLPGGKYKVVLTVQSRKVKADGSGNESPLPLNDLIDIGVFEGRKDEEKPLYLKKERLTRPTQTFEITVDKLPTRAGIDPYNKLIDRGADDNLIDVTRK